MKNITELIVNHITNSTEQRITFAEYMDLVLYDSQFGYYGSGKVQIGSQGDFFTSASLGKDFGELLAKQFVQMWELLGNPHPFMLVEMGAGQGLIAADILDYLQNQHQNLFQSLEYIIIEQAPVLIQQQQKLLQPWREQGVNLSWRSWSEIPINSIVGCCFSNELVDAFPVHRVVINPGKLQEIYLTYSETKLVEIFGELSTPKLTEYFQLIGVDLTSEAYPDGYCTEVNLAITPWLERVSQCLQRGYLLTIDYGYNAQRYYSPQRRQGTLQCYYQHRHHDNPYINLGEQDLTAHVDFTALERQGERCGLRKVGCTHQALFLMSLGLGDRLQQLSNPVTAKLDLGQLLRRRDALHQLIDPSGLGKFMVLVQGTEDCYQFPLQGLQSPGLGMGYKAPMS